MKKIYQYCIVTFFPMIVLLLLCVLYKSIICYFEKTSPSASLICILNWKDGLILLCSYFVIKLVSPFLGFGSVMKRIFLTFVLYTVFYAAYAFPFWLTSLLQPLATNVFIHILILIFLVEITFSNVIFFKKEDNFE